MNKLDKKIAKTGKRNGADFCPKLFCPIVTLVEKILKTFE